ncbi:MAG: dUTP diphosphatase [Candidatus Andersenbacteria bacterium]|nr:dUTP diphosphatase [Candidatus Andersenbacteria bacterium]
MIALKVKKLSADAVLPAKHNLLAAGIDIFTNESYTLQPGEVHVFTTGIAAEFPEGHAALIWDRSGFGSKGIHRLAGVIDSDYRGEWKIVLVNLSGKPYEVRAGDKIAQCVLQRFEPAEIVEVSQVTETGRGATGFGSSGR